MGEMFLLWEPDKTDDVIGRFTRVYPSQIDKTRPVIQVNMADIYLEREITVYECIGQL